MVNQIIKIFVLLVMPVSVWFLTIDLNVSVVKILTALIVTMIILSVQLAILSMDLTLKTLELVYLALTKTVINASQIILTAKSVSNIISKTQAMSVTIVKYQTA